MLRSIICRRVPTIVLNSFQLRQFSGETAITSKRTFNDRVRIIVKGGKGGAGCTSFQRLRLGKGSANGLNGADGGDVYLCSSSTLQVFNFPKFQFKGEAGEAGMRAEKGRPERGKDIEVLVPAGTVVHEILNPEPAGLRFYEDIHEEIEEGRMEAPKIETRFVVDLDRPGIRYLIAKGGTGGLGNRSFKTDQHRFNKFSTLGTDGELKTLLLELKTIADVGLVGFPNAGKSSFLAAISNATPKIAAYPFTTLSPNIGVVELSDYNKAKKRPDSSTASTESSTSLLDDEPLSTFTIADIPGLIDGAHNNQGLGHEFLRHIERCKVLLYVVDLASMDGRDPVNDFQVLCNELRCYSPELLRRPSLVLGNKIDRKPKTCEKAADRLRAISPWPVVTGSAMKGKNMKEVVNALVAIVEQQRRQTQAALRKQLEAGEREKLEEQQRAKDELLHRAPIMNRPKKSEDESDYSDSDLSDYSDFSDSDYSESDHSDSHDDEPASSTPKKASNTSGKRI